MDDISGWDIAIIFWKAKKLYFSKFVSYIFIVLYRSVNHKMYRISKNGVNSGLFKVENDDPME